MRLKYLADIPIQNGLGEPGTNSNPDWPRYIRTTDIAGPRTLRDDTFASLAPNIAQGAMLNQGDLLMTAAGATIGKSLLYSANGPACFAGYLVRFRANREVDPRFVAYWTESVPYWDQIRAGRVVSTIDNFSAHKYQNLRLSIPPLDLQRAIVEFLDREAARIDALIETQERLVDCIRERFSIAQQHLFIGPPTASRQPGICQGHLPAGWKATPFRWLFREVDERSTTGDERLLSVSQTRGIIPQDELGDRRQQANSYVGYKLCKRGDLVVNRMWVYYGALGMAHEPGLVSPDYSVFRAINADIDVGLVASTLKTPAYVAEMTMRVRGIGAAFQGAVRKPRLQPRELGDIVMPVPTVADRDKLNRQLPEEAAHTAITIDTATRFVELLRERRTALITAAVTGQLDLAKRVA
jgi:type I restriction enzyme S subunit